MDNLKSELIPSIGTAQLIGSINIVTIRCSCVKKEILMGQMGIPIVCHSCKKAWFVSATSQIKIQEMLIDLNKESAQSSFIKS